MERTDEELVQITTVLRRESSRLAAEVDLLLSDFMDSNMDTAKATTILKSTKRSQNLNTHRLESLLEWLGGDRNE